MVPHGKSGMKSKKGGKMDKKSKKSNKYWYAFDDDSWRVRKLASTPEKNTIPERDVEADYYGTDFYFSNDDVSYGAGPSEQYYYYGPNHYYGPEQYYGPDKDYGQKQHATGYYDTYDYYLNIPICPQPTPGPTFSPPPVFMPIKPIYVSFQILSLLISQRFDPLTICKTISLNSAEEQRKRWSERKRRVQGLHRQKYAKIQKREGYEKWGEEQEGWKNE